MARIPITVMGYRCGKCSKEWIEDKPTDNPEVCPFCKSKNWNKPNGPMLTYEDFCMKIVKVLERQAPLTWTEIRTSAGLPQKFPNNTWVHRMENDIHLERRKDSHGIIHWQLRGMEQDAPAA